MEILNFFEKHKEYLDKPITKDEINDVIYYCSKNWYLQILKEFGIVFVLIVLEYYKYHEEYLVCNEIVNTIKGSNKNFGTTYVEKLEDYDLS